MLSKLVKSFQYAAQGFPVAFRGRNMRIHGLAAVVVVIAGWWFQIAPFEWLVVLLLIGGIWALEMVNSALEDLADTVRDSLKLDYKATQIPRDLTAGAVLVLSVVAVICAMIIFIPKL